MKVQISKTDSEKTRKMQKIGKVYPRDILYVKDNQCIHLKGENWATPSTLNVVYWC